MDKDHHQKRKHPLIYDGSQVKFYAVNRGAGFQYECPAQRFIEEEIKDSDYKKLFTLFELISVHKGRLANREKFKDLGHEYRGKAFLGIKSFQIRIGCFWEPGFRLFMTHGFFKKTDDWSKGELQRLDHLYDNYLANPDPS